MESMPQSENASIIILLRNALARKFGDPIIYMYIFDIMVTGFESASSGSRAVPFTTELSMRSETRDQCCSFNTEWQTRAGTLYRYLE